MWPVNCLPADNWEQVPQVLAGEPSGDRKGSPQPSTHTCCVALAHTDIEFILGELGRMVVHITDLDDEDQGVVHVLSCQTTHNIEVNLGSRELC